ncbi:MAG: hypothetical protein ACD_11C00021G0018 [uncultured bacterium]|nr:MAG: hypothetical protein ACD_11C00021G0018 [uncultured bacterium]HBR71817.1 hypothetical protein [Candidatus Moranbacteria bacterium]
MRKISAFLAVTVVAGIVFSCTLASAYAQSEVKREGNDLVVYGPRAEPKIEKRILEAFDSSVKSDELDGQTALMLVKGIIPEYVPEKNSSMILKKIYHREFPMRLEYEKREWKYALNKEGKIFKDEIAVSSNEIFRDFTVDFFWRGVVLVGLVVVSFFSINSKRLIFFYMVVVASILLTSFMLMVYDIDTPEARGFFTIGITMVCGLAGFFIDKNLITGFLGGLFGVFGNLIILINKGNLEYANVGINDYITFLALACIFSFVVSRGVKTLIKIFQKRRAEAFIA